MLSKLNLSVKVGKGSQQLMIMTSSKSGTGSKYQELPMRCQLSKEVNYILTFMICPYTHTLTKVIQTLVHVLEEPSMGPLSSRVMAHWTRLCPMTKEFWSRGSASIHSATTSGGLRCSGVGPTPLEVSRERITNPSISTN